MIFELARSEQTYTFQRPMDYATFVLAGAIAAGWRHPVFIQGDHYQFNAKKYAADPEAMTEEIRRACRLAIDAGYRNIDIDSSTLVDLSKADRDEEQRENYLRAAELTALIRGLETDGVTVSVGGEIGEVGKQNSTADELEAYLNGYERELARLAPGAPGLSKVSVQTGTSHGGVPLPGGGVAEVKLDFEVLRHLGEIARARGLAGAVQHGASTLPEELFHHFPAVETAEIHLATGFQNALYEHPAFPASLMDEIYAWCGVNAADERKDGQTEEQFLYTTRKKAIGPFKRQLWDLDTRDEILAAQGRKLGVPVHRAAGQRVDGDGRAVREAGGRRAADARVARRRGAGLSGSAMTGGPGGVSTSEATPPLAVSIRLEAPGDEPGVRAVELAAFAGPEEADIVDRIRDDAPDGWRSLVAVDADGRIVGHLLMTPCPVEDDDGATVATVIAIGPVAVEPGGPEPGRRQRADGRGDEPRRRPCRAGDRAPGPPGLLPAVRVRIGARHGARAARRRLAGRGVDGPPAAGLDRRHGGHGPLPRGVRAARLTDAAVVVRPVHHAREIVELR